MTRIFRPVDPPASPISPSWKQWLGLLYVEGARSLAGIGRLFSHRWVKSILGLVGLVVQMVLLVLTWELVQVCADVAEMWLALARKHLELTS